MNKTKCDFFVTQLDRKLTRDSKNTLPQSFKSQILCAYKLNKGDFTVDIKRIKSPEDI